MPGDSEERDSGEGKVERWVTGDREVFRRVWEAQAVGPLQIERSFLGERGDLRRRRREMSFLDSGDVDRGCRLSSFFPGPRSPRRSSCLGCVVFSPSSPSSSTRHTQHLDSPIVELPLLSIYVSPTIHIIAYLSFSPESLLLSDLLLPNLALWTSAYYPSLFQGLSRSRAIISASVPVPYLPGVM